jgi:hypothetical protein
MAELNHLIGTLKDGSRSLPLVWRACPRSSCFGADAAICAASRARLRRPPASVSSATARTARPSRASRFSDKVVRWYTDCCRTPIGNTAGPRFLVVGLIHSFMSHEADGRSRDEVLGPALCRIYERSAIGPLPPNAATPPSFQVFVHRASKLLGWWVRGLGRPNPFFDDHTKAPRSAPRVLTPSERAALNSAA